MWSKYVMLCFVLFFLCFFYERVLDLCFENWNDGAFFLLHNLNFRCSKSRLPSSFLYLFTFSCLLKLSYILINKRVMYKAKTKEQGKAVYKTRKKHFFAGRTEEPWEHENLLAITEVGNRLRTNAALEFVRMWVPERD